MCKNGYVSTFWSTSPGVFLFTFLLVVFGKVRILVFISFCGTTKNFNLCVVAFKFAIIFRVSPRLVAMFLLPQNKLQRRFQVTGGSPFVQQSNSSFSQSRAIFPKDRAAVHSLVKVTRAPPPLGFRIPCFCQFAVAIAPGTCRADSTPRRI